MFISNDAITLVILLVMLYAMLMLVLLLPPVSLLPKRRQLFGKFILYFLFAGIFLVVMASGVLLAELMRVGVV